MTLTDNPPRRVLICGNRSFAARGLGDLVVQQGCAVTYFTRGAVAQDGASVTGPVDQMVDNPHLGGAFDTVVNYIVLKDELVEPNNAYLKSLLTWCTARGVSHLVHISSVSVYAGSTRDVDETTGIETNPEQKGAYAALKVAQDQFLLSNQPAGLKISFVRPGFVLAPGLVDPIVGMAARVPTNKLLCLGAAKNQLPCITRPLLNEAITRIVKAGPQRDQDVFILCDAASPTKKGWLQGAADVLGIGTGVVSLPVWFWLLAGVGAGTLATILRMKMKPYKVVKNACRVQRFNSTSTQQRLGMNFAVDWKAELVAAMDEQERDFEFPYPAVKWGMFSPKRISTIGYGGIVKQKHLPALEWLKFKGTIDAFDVVPRTDENGQVVQPIGATLPPADLYVVASPGRAHGQALPLLSQVSGPVLIEKPLCYSDAELEQWQSFAAGRKEPVVICHNYRFKKNVEEMVAHLRKYNPGKLIHVDLNFQSLPVSKHFPAWRRDERRAQTLLIEYALHFLDVACMFWPGDWNLNDLRYALNKQGQTSVIEGRMTNPNYSVNFLLRQGFIPRRARLLFTFQNYSTSLSFFPDTFVPYMSPDGPGLHKLEKKAAFRATISKVIDKLTNRDSDQSHPVAFLAASGDSPGLADGITVQRLAGFYRVLFEMSRRVYQS